MSLRDDVLAAQAQRQAAEAAEQARRQAEEAERLGDPEGWVVNRILGEDMLRSMLMQNGNAILSLPPRMTVTPRIEARLQELRDQGFTVTTEVMAMPPVPDHDAGHMINVHITA